MPSHYNLEIDQQLSNHGPKILSNRQETFAISYEVLLRLQSDKKHEVEHLCLPRTQLPM